MNSENIKLTIMKPAIYDQNLNTETYSVEQCFITELANTDNDPDASIARARVKPGVTTRWHRLHRTSERYCIIEGSGLMEVGDLPAQAVHPGDVVAIPPLTSQRITNTGSKDLIFLAICTPRFIDENYEDIEGQPA